ncbi:hypothetical protein JCM30237_03080 [Halolamina litorea]|uniref:Uncharacterized protein n=1 Tax=Halolamina litorea TaxID=1515593 RepID=A0ABD6BTF2_9EURY|nr:hypothetical protein [Halolamina litorea]
MDRRGTGLGATVGGVAFVLCFGMLTAERVGVFSLATGTESVIVWVGAAATVVLAAGVAYRVSDALGTWLAAFGPSLAFTLNLFLPVSTGLPATLVFAAGGGLAVATALALPGYVLGRIARMLDGGQ